MLSSPEIGLSSAKLWDVHQAFYFAVENYEKGEVKELEIKNPRLPFHPSCVHMKVNNGSKIKNLMGFAMSKLKVIFFDWP